MPINLSGSRYKTLKSNVNNNSIPVSFCGVSYSAWIPPLNIRKLSFKTNMFRDDVILSIPKYIQKRLNQGVFPKGVKLYCGASSFGHEPISLAMLLAEKKINGINYPIVAVELSQIARDMSAKGLLEITSKDLDKARNAVENPFKYLTQASTDLVDDYKLSITNAKLVKGRGDGESRVFEPVTKEKIKEENIFKVSDDIMQKIFFVRDDFANVKFDLPSVVLFRNCLMHFRSEERRIFLKSLYEKLPKGSSLVVSSGDLSRNVGMHIIASGFKPVNPKLKNINNWQKFKDNPETFIFEKN